MQVKLNWDRDFEKEIQRVISDIQNYVDGQCVERMEKYVPVALPKFTNAGQLRDSVRIAEPGKIIYTSRFARTDYYATKNHQRGGNPNAQRMWFEVMKQNEAVSILKGAATLIKKG